MPLYLAMQIVKMLDELQIVTDKHDKNVIIDNLIEDDFGYDYKQY